MPVDNKRLPVPEISIPYRLYTKLNTKSIKHRLREVVNEGLRRDGRKVNEQREMILKCGVVSQAKGSAYIEIDKTKIIVSVYDPREIPKKNDYSTLGELYCEFKYAPFSCPKRRMHIQDSDEKQNSAILKKALESAVRRHDFPNFQVDVYVLVLENDGSCLSAAITCAGLALAHAGIPMYDTITSLSLGIQGNIKLLDPSLEEEALCDSSCFLKEEKRYDTHGIIVLAMLSTHQQVSEFYQTGNLDIENLSEVMDILKKKNKDVAPLVKDCLLQNVKKSIKFNSHS